MTNSLLIVANWKANKTPVEAKTWLEDYEKQVRIIDAASKLEVAIAGPYTTLSTLAEHIKSDTHPLTPSLASQDVSQFPVGQYTGEVSATLLKELGVKYCLVGHSERRKHLGESTATVEKKLDQAMKNDITPIICAQTLEEIPENARNYSRNQYLIMYEPAYAISKNGQYTPEPAEKIQEVLSTWQTKLPPGVKFLYGGSVNPEIIHSYQQLVTSNPTSPAGGQRLVSGFVIGHASLDPASFCEIMAALCSSPA